MPLGGGWSGGPYSKGEAGTCRHVQHDLMRLAERLLDTKRIRMLKPIAAVIRKVALHLTNSRYLFPPASLAEI